MVNKLISAIAVAVVVATGVAPTANAAPKPVKYKNCAALNAAYPAGVAKSQAAARIAVADGNARPQVAAKVYALNTRLDRDDDLVACETALQAAAPPAAPVGIRYTLTGIPIYDALNQSRADKGEITQVQADALTRLGNAVTAPNINTRVKVCPLWSFEVFRTGYLNSAVTPQSLVALGLTPADSDWARTNLSDAVVSYCVGVGVPPTS